ncbi:MAG TPA: polysaccharide pyruvyl transferase CsaB [Bacillales bacterium]
MKVLISGYYGFGNAGDEALLYAIIELLRECDRDIDITVLSDKPEQTREAHHVHAVNRWSVFEVYKALKQADGLFSGGGSLLQDETSWRSIPYYTGIMILARMMGKPFVVFAQGLGPLRRGYNRRLVKAVLSGASFISMRDEESRALAKHLGIKKEIDLVPDPVLSLGNQGAIQRVEAPLTIVVSVRSWPGQEDYKQKIAATLDRCINNGFRVIFVPMHGEEDQIASENVKSLMAREAVVADYNIPFEDKLKIVGRASVLFGIRLHSLVFAAVNRVPFVALSYDPKVDAFARQCGQPIVGSLNDPWNENDLYELIVNQSDYKEAESDKLDNLISGLKGNLVSVAKRSLASLER